MTKLNKIILTIYDVMGWHDEDVLALTRWLEAYANLLGENQETRAVRCVMNALAVEGSFPTTDIEQWFQTILTMIAYDLMMIIGQRKIDNGVKADLKKIRAGFSLHIDFAASRFNNCFDQIDFEQDRESIIKQAIALLQQPKGAKHDKA